MNYLYNNAFKVSIDDNSKLVFISDVHRGDGTYFDSLMPNRNIYITALKYYLKNGFTYVEGGDGDELWKNRTCADIAYSHSDIFNILNKFKQKKRIYMIYGNHDMIKKRRDFKLKQIASLSKSLVHEGKEFLKFINDLTFYEGIVFNYIPLDENILVTHGHQVDLMNCELWMLPRFLVRYVWKFANGIAGFKEPNSPSSSHTKRSKEDKKLQEWASDNCKMIICGHTHNSRFPMSDEPPYFNDGACVLPHEMTALEIENGEISLVRWSVEAQSSGILWVRRNIIAGPNNISSYLLWARDERQKRNIDK